jgi:hypothetical protein
LPQGYHPLELQTIVGSDDSLFAADSCHSPFCISYQFHLNGFMPKSSPLSLTELNALLPRIQATVAALVGNGHRGRAAVKASNGRKAGRASSRSRAGAAELRDKLLSTLKGAKGLALSQVVKRVGGSRVAVQYHLKILRGQRKARVVGKRGGARWFAA